MSSVTGERLSPQPHHDLTDRFYLDQVFPQGNRVGDATAVRLWEKGILQTRVWRKEKQLSADGFGTVWREREETSNEVRTLKRIRRDKDKASLQEIAALATFSAPRYLQHFADFYGWYLDSGYVYLSLEYFEHGDLHRCIGRLSQPLPEQEAKSIVHQVLNGVKCLHDRNFTHRDLKPNNIFVLSTSPEWHVKIGDFGCSKRIREQTRMQTRTGIESYMAPETSLWINPEGVYTNAVDVWSIGCITYEILTLRVLFPEPAPELRVKDYYERKTISPEQCLRDLGFSEAAAGFVQASLARDHTDRPSADSLCKGSWLADLTVAQSAASEGSALQTLYFPSAPRRQDEELTSRSHVVEQRRSSSRNSSQLRQMADKITVESSRLTPSNDTWDTQTNPTLSASPRSEIEEVDLNRATSLDEQFKAVADNDVGFLRSLARRDLLSDHHDETGRSLCHAAAAQNRVELLSFLSKHHLSLNTMDLEGKRPLYHAIEHGHCESVCFLLSRKVFVTPGLGTEMQIAFEGNQHAVLDVLLDSGFMDLSEAFRFAVKGKFPIIQRLVPMFPYIDITDIRARRLLHYACEAGNLTAVQLLLDADAKPDVEDQLESPVTLALKHGDAMILQQLLSRGATLPPSVYEDAKDAISEGNLPVCRLLLSARPSLATCWQDAYAVGRSWLQIASNSGHTDMVKVLLSAGSDPIGPGQSHRRHSSETPLGLAIARGHDDIVRILVMSWKSLGNKARSLPFHDVFAGIRRSALQGKLDLLGIFIEEGSSRPAVLRGKTIIEVATLIDAMVARQYEAVRLLIATEPAIGYSRMDLTKGSTPGAQPLHLAVQQEFTENGTLDNLLSKGANPHLTDLKLQTPLHIAVIEQNYTAAQVLAKRMLQFDQIDEEGHASLHLAVMAGDLEMVQLLLQHGASVHVQTRVLGDPDQTPLHFATASGNNAIVQCLLDRGADLYAQTARGETILHLAAGAGHVQICEWILTKTQLTLLNKPCRAGKTPLQYAIDNGAAEATSLLESYAASKVAEQEQEKSLDETFSLTEKPPPDFESGITPPEASHDMEKTSSAATSTHSAAKRQEASAPATSILRAAKSGLSAFGVRLSRR